MTVFSPVEDIGTDGRVRFYTSSAKRQNVSKLDGYRNDLFRKSQRHIMGKRDMADS
jgi:hypothetical protein